ncbi:portal protein [Pseudolabrys taiwanensis]|uniref:Portal protein n=1 Tax=Pseudolabrys taiwanensis TaxID=331696 RepID=A0A345ZQR8_9HYPH|nr:cation:proton antiporter [Pseudolabrys taiwanensis]AXK79265.1 portal protein [Pseudolabrys taiwanensis]
MLHAENLKGLIVFLVVAGVIVPLFHRARIGTVLGFLIAGVVLGPHGLGRLEATHPWIHYITFDDPQRSEALAEFGIIILLFLLGLELSLQRFWQLRRYVLGIGFAQVVITTSAIGLAVRFAGGVPPAGIVLGLCLTLSSTAIVMQILAEQHRVAHPVGRIALSVLLFQDLMVVPILFIVGMLGGGGEARASSIYDLITPFAGALASVIAIMLAGRFLLGPLLRSVVKTGSRDLIMALALLILVCASVATGLAGLSVALGAFLAGLLLSENEARHHIEVDLEPFKGLLLGLFFITVGTNLDLFVIARDIGWILLAVVVLLAGKALILYVIARAFGVTRTVAAEVALLLAQTGEFAFVVLGVAQQRSLLPQRLIVGAIAVVSLSMMLTPLCAALGRRFGAKLVMADHLDEAPGPDQSEMENHVVIGGCGRVGQLIAEALEAEGIPYVCLDLNGEAVALMRRQGRPAYFGDACRTELLEKVGAQRARAFVVTLNRARGAERMVVAARKINRSAFIFARAADPTHAARLIKLGAFGVIPETVEAGLQLAGRLMETLDLSDDTVARRLSDMRAAEVAKLDRAEAGEA